MKKHPKQCRKSSECGVCPPNNRPAKNLKRADPTTARRKQVRRASAEPRDAEAQWWLWPSGRTVRAPAETSGGDDGGTAAPERGTGPSLPNIAALRRAVLAVHGVGGGTADRRAGFSDKLRRRVFRGSGESSIPFWHECVWEDINDALDTRLAEFVRAAARGPLFCGLPQGARRTAADWVCRMLDFGLDYWLYLDSAHGAKIRSRLRARIAAAAKGHQDGVVLVAHSLGSVVAYDVLAEARRKGVRLPVAALVTFGSPLAWTFTLRETLAKSECANHSLGSLPWTNIYYREDCVCLYKPLPADRFPEARNVVLPLPKRATARTAHAAYWRDGEVARIVREAITKV